MHLHTYDDKAMRYALSTGSENIRRETYREAIFPEDHSWYHNTHHMLITYEHWMKWKKVEKYIYTAYI